MNSGCSYEALTYLFGQNISTPFLSANKIFFCLSYEIRGKENLLDWSEILLTMSIDSLKVLEFSQCNWIRPLTMNEYSSYQRISRNIFVCGEKRSGDILAKQVFQCFNEWPTLTICGKVLPIFLAQTAYQSWTIIFIWWRAFKQNKAKPTKNT